MALEEYKRKRDFTITSEPEGGATEDAGDLKFVIQKHSARRLHYDFRLEAGGVLVSWAVPKGPSLDPSLKRLAVQTEDHPFDYRNFEGVIPEGEYGAGPVIIWDEGTFAPTEHGQPCFGDRKRAEKLMRDGLRKGKLSFILNGKRLHGSWTLFRLANKQKDWILLKHRDDEVEAGYEASREASSVVSGRTLEQVKNNVPAIKTLEEIGSIPGSRKRKMPAELDAELASLADGPFDEPGWIYEPKFDGIRAIATIKNGKVRLTSRRGLDLTPAYPEITQALSAHDEDMILDGEIVAFSEKGIPSFQALQQRSGLSNGTDIRRAQEQNPVNYYVFDIMHIDKYSLLGVQLEDRKQVLADYLIQSHHIRLVDRLPGSGYEAFQAAVEVGLEGIVGKRLSSTYQEGKRSKDWLKVKAVITSEFVIAGYTEGTGSRASTFGALILGYYDKNGNLSYAGGCGTGFNDKTLRQLQMRFKTLQTSKSPFRQKVPGKRIVWLKPELVAEVKFAEWTQDNMLRAPVFLRLRDDKAPTQCTRDEIVHDVKSEAPKHVVTVQELHDTGQVVDLAAARRKKAHPDQQNRKIDEALEETLKADRKNMVIDVEGNKLSLTNLDKVFWPAFGDRPAITKRDYMLYLLRVSPWLLPHCKDRPVTFMRFPNGINNGKFYQKHWEKGLPDFAQTIMLYAEQAGTDQEYVVCNNLATLLWLAQIADLELHTWQSRIASGPDGNNLPSTFTGSVEKLESSLLNYPDYLLFDLDPYLYSGKEQKGEEPELHREGFQMTVQVARWFKEILDTLGIECFLKTTGKTGLHIYVPIVREFSFDEVRAISGKIAEVVLAEHPHEVTMEWSVSKRTGKVFLDHNMNSRGKTLASIYSPRVSPEATVSFPVTFEELDSIYPNDFTMMDVVPRLRSQGDAWADILQHKNDLKKIVSGESRARRRQIG